MARLLSSSATASLSSVIDGDKARSGVGGLSSPGTSWTCNELPRRAPRLLAVARWCAPPLPASSHSSLLTVSADSCSRGRLWSTTKVIPYINGGLSHRFMTSASPSEASRAHALAWSRTIRGAFGRFIYAACDRLMRLYACVHLCSVGPMERGEERGEERGAMANGSRNLEKLCTSD